MDVSTLLGDDRSINVAYSNTIRAGLGRYVAKPFLRSIQAHKVDLKSAPMRNKTNMPGVKDDKSPIDYRRHFAAESGPGALIAGDAGYDILTKI
jgi:hypothetical protein